MNNQLMGYWVIDSVEEHAPEYYAQVYLRITGDGLLQWGYEKPERTCVVSFHYWLEGGAIVTVTPPYPRKDFTPYSISADGKLRLKYSNYETVWARTTGQVFFTGKDTWEPDPLDDPDYMDSLELPPSEWQCQVAASMGVPPQLVINTNALWRAWRYSHGPFTSLHLDEFEYILGLGVLPDWRCNEDRTLLMYVAGEGYEDAVKLLLDSRYDINARDLHGATALNHAIYRGRKEIIALLLSRGAKAGDELG